jgi:excisionase family DNA binding protein
MPSESLHQIFNTKIMMIKENEKPTFDTLPECVGLLMKEVSSIKLLLEQQNFSKVDNEKPLSVSEACAFLNLAQPTIYSLHSRNEIPAMRKNGRLYFFKQDLIDYLKSGKKAHDVSTSAIAHVKIKGGRR